MCIAIVKPKGIAIHEEYLRASWIANPDGAGFAYVKEGKVVVEKGFMTLAPFIEAYKQAADSNKKSNFLIHFRIRSMGDKSDGNTHPFEYEHGCMIHNGTLDGTGAKWGEGGSDTKLFLDKFKEKLTLAVLDKYKTQMGEAIGVGNKLAFLFNGGQYRIINEQRGLWRDGIWYSNSTYLPRAASTYPGTSDYYNWVN